jgi:hypothetical protein
MWRSAEAAAAAAEAAAEATSIATYTAADVIVRRHSPWVTTVGLLTLFFSYSCNKTATMNYTCTTSHGDAHAQSQAMCQARCKKPTPQPKTPTNLVGYWRGFQVTSKRTILLREIEFARPLHRFRKDSRQVNLTSTSKQQPAPSMMLVRVCKALPLQSSI